MMEMKWYFIAMAMMMVAMFAGLAYDAHTKSNCALAYATSNWTAAEIQKICGR